MPGLTRVAPVTATSAEPPPPVPASTAEIVAAVRAAEGPDGRLAVPPVVEWDIFPFEGELLVKRVDDPVLPEPPRRGDPGGPPCTTCTRPDADYLWTDEHWRLTAPTEGPLGVPAAVLLEPREHLDLGDLPPGRAAELGPLLLRVERAMASLDGVGRVHVNRWGDGGAHLHVWFFARPAGMLQLRGSSLPDWTDVLPALPADRWHANLAAVAASMAGGGGTAPG